MQKAFNRLIPSLLLILWGVPALAFPIKFPGQGDPENEYREEFKIGDITIDPATLNVGDVIKFEYTLPVRTTQNVEFMTENRAMPDFLEATNTDELAFPVQNYRVDSLIAYTVVSLPRGKERVSFSVWGYLDSQNFSLGEGLSRVSLVRCGNQP